MDGSGIQETVSEGHPFHQSKEKGRTDLGGDFFTTKSWLTNNPSRVKGTVVDGNFSTTTDAAVLPVPASALTSGIKSLFPPTLHSNNVEMDRWGATAIARCAPTNSVADVSTALGELIKDGLPALVGTQALQDRTKPLRGGGSEYLNYQFGWAPLVSDARKIAYAASHAEKILSQYERDAGRVVRRRYNFPVEREYSSDTVYNGVVLKTIPYSSMNSTYAGSVVREREITRRRWFSGAFTYYLPTGYDARSKMTKYALLADKLFGISLTPDTVWNLAPWSWAVDWFSNTGDVVSNLSAFASQGLIMRYGYIMEHTRVSDTYICHDTQKGNGGSVYDPSRGVAPLTLITETKVRRRANPFGFGVSWDGLSAFQTSILAALGITRR